MSDEIQSVTEPTEPATEPTEPNTEGEGATPPAEPSTPTPPEPENPFDGIDTNLWDETGFKQAETIQAIKAMKETAAKKDKQILDLRRVISKGVETPESAEDYSKDYQPSKEFEKYYAEQGTVRSSFLQEATKEINEMAFEKGMTVAQAGAVKDFMNQVLKELSIFPDESDEAKVRIAEAREKVLGKDAEQLIQGNKKAIANYNGWTDDEKNALIGALDKDPVLAGALDKYRQLAFGTRGSIPAREYSTDTLPDDYTLAAEYQDPKTSDRRREQIIAARIEAGRTGPLPIGLST